MSSLSITDDDILLLALSLSEAKTPERKMHNFTDDGYGVERRHQWTLEETSLLMSAAETFNRNWDKIRKLHFPRFKECTLMSKFNLELRRVKKLLCV